MRDDSLSLAIGKKGVNVRLASKLTGIKIDVITESQATEDQIEYTTSEELESIATALKAEKISAAQQAAAAAVKETVLPGLPEGYVAPQERVYENEKNDFDEALQEVSEKEEENVKPEPKAEPVVEKEPAKEEEAPAPAPEQTVVKTTTSLSDLEASLEAQSNKENNKKSNFKKKKKVEEEVEEEAPVTKSEPVNGMSIYTEEELAQFKEEEEAEEDYEEDDIDYDDYDDYYDEDK